LLGSIAFGQYPTKVYGHFGNGNSLDKTCLHGPIGKFPAFHVQRQ
jgi:hypothetical protein